ncbi:MAG: VPLPA-CTERM sorting domain-containing protein [Gammaproteobacteria bacterium]|nr:VPLPA-CTERM sorting domain-containing protein [Gammaproteobacteria bacterium]
MVFKSILCAISICLAVISTNANAATVQYNYYGGALKLGTVPIESTVFGFITAPELLLPNSIYNTELGWTVDYEFFFGGESISSASLGPGSIEVRTDSVGRIYEWILSINQPNPAQLGLRGIFSIAEFDTQSGWHINESVYICNQIITSSSCYVDPITQVVGGSTPTWSLATVPVPAAVWLFGSGLIGLIGVASRKKAYWFYLR